MSIRTDCYAYIYDQLEAARREMNDCEARALELRREMTRLGAFLVVLRDETCMHCKGKGEVWVMYAQDDSKLEKCPACKGTGERK